MRFKESLALDRMIEERRLSLSRDDLDELDMDKRVLVLATLMEARRRLDEIGGMQARDDVVVHTKFVGTAEDGRKIRPRRRRDLRCRHPRGGFGDINVVVNTPDQPQDGRQIAKQIRRELRRSMSDL